MNINSPPPPQKKHKIEEHKLQIFAKEPHHRDPIGEKEEKSKLDETWRVGGVQKR